MSKLVSVIIPAYNVEQYIQATLRSVQNQTWHKWEAIVVDDGSIDKTADKIKALASADKRIRLIQQTNAGSSSARNTGLKAAQGTYIAFLDGDDEWKPDLLRKLMTAKEAAGTGFAYCGYTHVYDRKLKRGFRHPYPEGDILSPVVAAKTHIQIGCTLIDKEIIEKNNVSFVDGCLVGQDHEFIIKILALTTATAVPQELLNYRIRAGSAIHAKWQWQKHIHAVHGVRRSRDFVFALKQDSPDYQKIKSIFEQRIASQWYRLIWRMVKKGFYSEAMSLLDDPTYAEEMKLLNYKEVSRINALKFKVVASRNLQLWQKINKFKFL